MLLRVGGASGQVGDLPGQVDPLGRSTGSPQHVVAGEQAGREGGRISVRAGQHQRLRRQRSGPRTVLGDRMGQFPGQVGGELRLQQRRCCRRARDVRSRAGQDGVAGHGESGAEPVHSQGDMPESFSIVSAVARRWASSNRSRAPGGSPARAWALASSTSRSTSGPPACSSPDASIARRARAKCAAASLNPSRARSTAADARAQRIARAAPSSGTAAAQCRASSAARPGRPGVAVLERVGDPLVQGDPLRDREPKVDRLAEPGFHRG